MTNYSQTITAKRNMLKQKYYDEAMKVKFVLWNVSIKPFQDGGYNIIAVFSLEPFASKQ